MTSLVGVRRQQAAEARRGFVWPYPTPGMEAYGFAGTQYFGVATEGAGGVNSYESPISGYRELVYGPFKSNPIVFACELKRLSVFSEARFVWRGYNKGRPGKLFGSPELDILSKPWPRGATGDLLANMILSADIGGNAFVHRDVTKIGTPEDRLRVLRPDFVTIVMGDTSGRPVESAHQLDAEIIGFIYNPSDGQTEPEVLLADEVAHWAPIPDPLARFRGMSWMTPIIREAQADQAASLHKLMFFENGATPQLVVSFDKDITEPEFRAFTTKMDQAHNGWRNAYKCLHPETEVAMWDGRRLRADEVHQGDIVVAWDGTRTVPGPVAAAEKQPPSPIVTVTTQRGRVIKTNDRHPFLARRPAVQRPRMSDLMWIEAADLRRGDLLVAGLGWAADDTEDTLTPYEAWTLGVIVGDGSTISSTPVLSAWDSGIRNRMEIGHRLVPTGKGHDYRVLGIRAACVRAGIMGKRSWEKRIPEQVMIGSAKVRSAFLSGLVDTDGHVTDPLTRRSAEVGITSTSRGLLTDAQHLFASLGVNASVTLSMPAGRTGGAAHGNGPRSRDAWRLHAFGNDQARQLAQILDLACTEKAERLAQYAARLSLGDRSRYDRVVSVEIGPPETTIGIEIAGHHTHVTGGVVTHNTLYVGGGATPTVVGKDLTQLDFSSTQGHGETRIASASGIHPVLIPLSEGMQGSSLNAGNYDSARRSTADMTLRPLWRGACAALAPIIERATKADGSHAGPAELWYDEEFIPFLRDDSQKAADIEAIKAKTINEYVREGFTWESSIAAVQARDVGLLVHTGLFSVQLQELAVDANGQPTGVTGPPQGPPGSPTIPATTKPQPAAALPAGNGQGGPPK